LIEQGINPTKLLYEREKRNEKGRLGRWVVQLLTGTVDNQSLGSKSEDKRPNRSDCLDHSTDAKEYSKRSSIEKQWLLLELLLDVTN
jgi:hypothetical protein